MALDTNIALGVKPIEQPNMLAQMGQMMQLRQAQQGFESENALRDFYAQGGDLSTAEGKRQLMSRAPGAGMKLIGQQSEISARDINTAEKSLGMLKDQAGLVRTPEDAANWLTSFYKNPLTRPYVEAIAPIDKALAAIPTDPAALQGWLRNASLKAKDIFESADTQLNARTRIQAANIGASAGNRQASIAEQRFAIEKAQQAEIDALFGKPPSSAPAVAPMGGGSGGGVPNALPATVGASAAAPAPTNMLVPGAQAPATASVPAAAPAITPATAASIGDPYDQIKAIDAKIAPLVNSGNPRATAIVQQLIAQRNAILESAKREFGGAETTMEVTDPKTGIRTVVKARPNEYGVLVPIEMAPVPLSTDANATGGENISPTVARPAPSAAVLKERQVAEKLPEAIAMNTDAIRKIDEMIGGVDAKGKPLEGAKGQPHPGLSKATGLGGGVMRFFSGTEGKNFEIRHKEVLSQAFLDAFEALKGGGAITEKEGEKATAARTRMDLAQSKEEYMTAAREYQGVLKRGVENARARMQRSGTTPPAGAPEDPLGIR
jgi:hypothetical protein